ncbi:MAG: hypothetical protein H7X93_13225 [Sphingomonadaceae bacterium]|nr:hypothetical protein [Sphingomonadaceae bacterium]
MNPITFLRRVLATDSLTCAVMGIALIAAAETIASAIGLPRPLVFGAGVALIPIALFIGWLATRSAPPGVLVWLVIAGNIAWSAESVITLAQYAGAVTPFGEVFIAGQAVAVLGITLLEYLGLRRMRAAAA